MKKGFTQIEKQQLQQHLENIDSSLDLLVEFLREKHERAEEWVMDRSERWIDSDKSQEFEDWLNELDFKTDQVEDLKSEIDLESFEEVL